MGNNLNPVWLAKYFGFELIDYNRAGDSLLIASGCGIMMSVMDNVQRFRYAIDIDTFRELNNRVPQMLSALDQNCNFNLIGIVGWFTLDKPDALIDAQTKIRNASCLTYSGNYGVFQNETKTLAEFIEKATNINTLSYPTENLN